ncbi:hypothetical protein G9A89_005822 [Geosiphon pyriformis]|nr:hypothetical protein G9A89_005822 [Geosiphon pyriformis]
MNVLQHQQGDENKIPPHPFDIHEGIPEEVEFEHVAELKRIAADKAREETIGTGFGSGIRPGSAASLAQSALGKYATAIGEEIRAPSLIVQARVKAADHPVNEAQLVQELKEEAEKRKQFELATQGYVPRAGPASKVEEAAERLEQVLHIDEGRGQQAQGNSTPNRGQRVGRVKQIPATNIPMKGTRQNFGSIPKTKFPITTHQGQRQEKQNSEAIPNTQAQDVEHEGIPQSIEFENLSKLKEVASEHASGYVSGNIPRGSVASIAQSAMGKYATAISEEIHVPALSVQGMVPPVRDEIDLEELVNRLKEEAESRQNYEIRTFGGVIPNGPANKVAEAAEKLLQVLQIDRDQLTRAFSRRQETPADQSYSSQLSATAAPFNPSADLGGQQKQQATPPASPSIMDGNLRSQIDQGVEHEKIPLEEEMQTLSDLKQVVRDHAKNEGAPIQKGSVTSQAQSSMGKYSTGISRETGIPPLNVQGAVESSGHPINENELAGKLRSEAQLRREHEESTGEYAGPTAPSSETQVAANKMEEVVTRDNSQ